MYMAMKNGSTTLLSRLARVAPMPNSAWERAAGSLLRETLHFAAPVAMLCAVLLCPAAAADKPLAAPLSDLIDRAQSGDASSQLRLGEVYATGEELPCNKAEAMKWYRLSASQGNAKAAFLLGFMYEVGDGVPKYSVEAARWYRQAAEGGDARAQYLLAAMYARGDGVSKDPAESAKWVLKAAELGNSQAQALLLKEYNAGAGIFSTKADAANWFRKVAVQGNAFAQYQLGIMYSAGDGVAKDGVEALAWLNLSAQTGDHDYVKARNRLEAELGATVALRGQERSRELMAGVAIAIATKESAITAQGGL